MVKAAKSQEKTTEKNADKTIEKLRKSYGEDAIQYYGDSDIRVTDVISTGLPALDAALGVGGFPRGRIIEVYGPESSGKTTLALQVLVQAQKLGDIITYIDLEHALDPTYVEALGIDMENLLIAQPNSAEQALGMILDIAEAGEVDVIVLDSVAALAPQAEKDGSMADQVVGVIPRMMSKVLRLVSEPLHRNNGTLIFINQMRKKIGMMGYGGNPETTPGGEALKYYASVRIDVRRIGALKDSSEKTYGNKTKIKIVKNKVAAPFKEIETELIFGEGFSKEADLINIAIEKDVIKKSGSWFSCDGKNLSQGKDKLRLKLIEDKELYAEIVEKLKNV